MFSYLHHTEWLPDDLCFRAIVGMVDIVSQQIDRVRSVVLDSQLGSQTGLFKVELEEVFQKF